MNISSTPRLDRDELNALVAICERMATAFADPEAFEKFECVKVADPKAKGAVFDYSWSAGGRRWSQRLTFNGDGLNPSVSWAIKDEFTMLETRYHPELLKWAVGVAHKLEKISVEW